MARVLYDGLVDYEDGTPATTSQMAKDVVEFLNWSAEPEMDIRKKMGAKVLVITTVLFALSVWVKRYVRALPLSSPYGAGDRVHLFRRLLMGWRGGGDRYKWSPVKTRKIVYNPPVGRPQ
ncbi:MAG: hypothetical protein LQ347_005305, partial [Umbilicaria vellea]